MEQLSFKRQKPFVAFVTMIPAVVEALIGEVPVDLNRRFISKIRLTDDPTFNSGLNEFEKGNEQTSSKLVIDLFILPTILGHWDTKNKSNIADLASKLDGYDLVVDLSEMTALYRRGHMEDKYIEKASEEFPDVPNMVNKNFLEYRNFLKVVNSLGTLMKCLRGRIIRPRVFDAAIYEWGRSPTQSISIRDMSVIKNWSRGMSDEGWINLDQSEHDRKEGAIFGAVTDANKPGLKDAWKYLKDNGMDTLKHRIMISDYTSDLSYIMDRLICGTPESEGFTSELSNILDYRQDEKVKYSTFSNLQKEKIKRCRDKLELTYAELKNSGKEVHLIDYLKLYELLKQSEDDNRMEEFKRELPNTFAFMVFWHTIENQLDESDLNHKINGWYIANSSYWVLRQAVDSRILQTPLTVWSYVTWLTNSVGFLPSREEHLLDIREAVFREVLQLIPVETNA